MKIFANGCHAAAIGLGVYLINVPGVAVAEKVTLSCSVEHCEGAGCNEQSFSTYKTMSFTFDPAMKGRDKDEIGDGYFQDDGSLETVAMATDVDDQSALTISRLDRYTGKLSQKIIFHLTNKKWVFLGPRSPISLKEAHFYETLDWRHGVTSALWQYQCARAQQQF